MTQKQKHSAEPWAIPVANVFRICSVPKEAALFEAILLDPNTSGPWDAATADEASENVKRVIACVNAMAGIRRPNAFVSAILTLLYYCQLRKDALTPAQKAALQHVLKVEGVVPRRPRRRR